MKLLFLCAFWFCISFHALGNDPIKALIVTGEHSFEREAFFEMFDSFSAFSFTEVVQPQGNILIEEGGVEEYDLLIFYDMYDSITETQKEASY